VECIEPGVTLGDLSACQSYPHRAVEPARTLSQGGEKWLAQKEAFAGRCDRPEPQFASLVPPVQHDAPPEGRPFLPIPVEHSDQLFT